MPTYTPKYRLTESPFPHSDSSGLVDLTILAVISRDGGAYTEVPGYSRFIGLPYLDLKAVMDLPHATPAQKTAKNNAIKNLIAIKADNVYSPPPLDWTPPGIVNACTANDGAATEAARLHSYLTVTLGLTYPVDFNV